MNETTNHQPITPLSIEKTKDLFSSGLFPSPESIIKRNLKTPQKIKDYLDSYVVGQEDAKMVLAVAAYEHQKRIYSRGIEKSNILIAGPTGSGKTLLVSTLARCLDVPFVASDATIFTEAGFKGADVDSVITRLYHTAGENKEKAETGIVFIDEIDKIAKGSKTNATYSIEPGEGVQQAFLKLMEGSDIEVHDEDSSDTTVINTSKILFIFGGAFTALNNIVMDKTCSSSMGFNSNPNKNKENNLSYLKAKEEDFVSFGLIKEFLGRIPIKVFLNPIGEEECIKILTEPKNSIISQFINSYKFEDANLIFTKSAIKEVAKKSVTMGLGARGLRSIVEKALLQTSFKIPSMEGRKKVTVTKECIEGTASPEIVFLDEE